MTEGALDLPSVLERVGGDKDLLREIACIFLEEYPVLLGSIREAVTAGDAQGLERAAHSLKGSVSNFGAVDATAAAFALERIARQDRMPEAPAALLQLETEFDKVVPVLGQVVRGEL